MQTKPREAGPGELANIAPIDRAGMQAGAIDFRIIAEKSLSLIMVADHTGVIEYVNPFFCECTGFTPAEVIGRRVHDLGQIDQPTLVELWNSLGFGQAWRGEFAAVTKSGRELWVNSSVSPITDGDGRVTHFIAVNVDITDRKRAEEALRQSEEMFRTLVDTMPAAAVIFQGNHICYANRTCFEVLGYSREDLLRLNYWDAVHPEYRDLVRERGSARLRGEDAPNNYEVRFLKKNGEARWGIYSGARVTYQGKAGVLGVIHDITDRKQAEEALRQSEQTFRAIVETTREVIWSTDLDSTVRYVNPSVEAVLGYRPEELLGTNAIDLLHPEDWASMGHLYSEFIASKSGWSHTVARWRHKDGRWRYVESSGAPQFGPDGAITGYAGNCRDITERIESQEALRRSEEQYRLLYQDNPSMYFTLGDDLSVLSVNQHGAEQLGYTPDELLGQTVFVVVHPDDQGPVRRQLESLVRRRGSEHGIEFRKVRKDGSVIWVKENVRLTHDVDGRPIILVVCEDISERKRMEEAIQGLREELERKAECAVAGKNPYGLSFRELTVVHLVTGGRSDKEIGVILGIRPQTVSKHVANILKKMNASSRTEAGVRALREGLIS